MALSTGGGRIVETDAPELLGRRLAIPREGGEVGRELGLSLVAERVDGGGFLIWEAGHSLPVGAAALEASLLGRDGALVAGGGRSVDLSPRHSEILCLLALAPEGLGAERLALQLYGEFGKPVTARAELSRLRRALPGAIVANPYRLAVELRDDRRDGRGPARGGPDRRGARALPRPPPSDLRSAAGGRGAPTPGRRPARGDPREPAPPTSSGPGSPTPPARTTSKPAAPSSPAWGPRTPAAPQRSAACAACSPLDAESPSWRGASSASS